MKKAKNLAVIALVCMAGCIFFQNLEREGFNEEDLTIPSASSYTFNNFEEKPQENAFIGPTASYRLSWEFAALYAGYRGVFRINVENMGSYNLFIYGFAIKIDGKEQKDRWDDGKIVVPGDKEKFFFSFNCPSAGNHSYKLGVYIMAERNGRWHDYGLEYSDEKKEFEVRGYANASYKLRRNYYYYFDKVNELVNPYEPIIYQKAYQITSSFGNGYNIAKVCAIFDWVYENVPYENETGDEWIKPSIALYEGGDCEEFAMLISAMVEAIGGTARVYITDNHAFAAIYIGKDISLLKSIDAYYHANLNYALLHDEFGYWIVADPLAYFYLGGLPVGGIVEEGGYKLYEWSILTEKLHAIDVLRE